MGNPDIKHPTLLDPSMIAPCGMNCGVCRLAFRAKDGCCGCGREGAKPQYCFACRIRNCDEIRLRSRPFCFECHDYPCPRLRRLDARYRARYRMSMIENLESIRQLGLDRFVELEKQRWTCRGCGALICVHKQNCIYCEQPRS